MLVCGCCGQYFDTWVDYEDQDQDKGFGICASCQELEQKRLNEQYDELFIKIEEAFQDPANLARWQGLDRDMKVVYANMMIEEGIITFHIGG